MTGWSCTIVNQQSCREAVHHSSSTAVASEISERRERDPGRCAPVGCREWNNSYTATDMLLLVQGQATTAGDLHRFDK